MSTVAHAAHEAVIHEIKIRRGQRAEDKGSTRSRNHFSLFQHGPTASFLTPGSLSFWSFALCPLISALSFRIVAQFPAFEGGLPNVSARNFRARASRNFGKNGTVPTTCTCRSSSVTTTE